jgi:hypothetical protein
MRPAVAHVIPHALPPARRLQPEQRAAGSGEAVKDSKYWYTAPLAELDAEIERRLQHPLTNEDELKMFRGILRTQGAWKDNPWENCIEDIRAMREEWAHRDPWNPDLEKRHRD